MDGKIECPLIRRPGDEEFNVRDARLGTCKGRLRKALISTSVDNRRNILGIVLKFWELSYTTEPCWSLVHNAALEMQVNKFAMLLAIHPTNPMSFS